MSSFQGLIKANFYCNRHQQKRDWFLITKAIGKELTQPDWSMSVKKIDKYMEDICKQHNLNHLDFFGCG